MERTTVKNVKRLRYLSALNMQIKDVHTLTKLTPPLCSLSWLGACVANATKALMCWQVVIDANHTTEPLYLSSVLCSFNAILLCTCSVVCCFFFNELIFNKCIS